MAHLAGPLGDVVAVEIDPVLAAAARRNLAASPQVDVRTGDGAGVDAGESFDIIFVNAGVTHPLDVWLDALAEGGRMILPLTVPMTPAIGKGLLLRIARRPRSEGWDARIVTYMAIYSAIGIRAEAFETRLGQALKANPMPSLKRLRRDSHAATPGCWLHSPTFCLSTE
jgi:protein-L-isoaspartate(D-aspartate) O-methyltransferase